MANLTPFEIRLELLKMAKDMLTTNTTVSVNKLAMIGLPKSNLLNSMVA
jgi:hypothetical protein